MVTGTGSFRGDGLATGARVAVAGGAEVTKACVLDWLFDCRRTLWRTSALVSALASSRLVTIGIPNSAAFLLMRYSSLSIRWDAGSPSRLGMLITSRISLFWR